MLHETVFQQIPHVHFHTLNKSLNAVSDGNKKKQHKEKQQKKLQPVLGKQQHFWHRISKKGL